MTNGKVAFWFTVAMIIIGWSFTSCHLVGTVVGGLVLQQWRW